MAKKAINRDDIRSAAEKYKNCDDLDMTAKKQKVELKRGDYIVVRTGQMERCLKAGSWDGYPGGDAPGFSFETLEWVQRTQLAALASAFL